MLNKIDNAPPVELFELGRKFQKDSSADKMNLGLGAYRTVEGVPWELPAVKQAGIRLVEQLEQKADAYEYVPYQGMPCFTSTTTTLLLGPSCPATAEGRVLGVQSVGGTGAVKIGAEFLHRVMGLSTVYI